MDTTDWGILIGGATLIATIVIGILQLTKKTKDTYSAKVFGFGDAVNGDKVNGDKVNGDKVNGDKVNGDKVKTINV